MTPLMSAIEQMDSTYLQEKAKDKYTPTRDEFMFVMDHTKSPKHSKIVYEFEQLFSLTDFINSEAMCCNTGHSFIEYCVRFDWWKCFLLSLPSYVPLSTTAIDFPMQMAFAYDRLEYFKHLEQKTAPCFDDIVVCAASYNAIRIVTYKLGEIRHLPFERHHLIVKSLVVALEFNANTVLQFLLTTMENENIRIWDQMPYLSARYYGSQTQRERILKQWTKENATGAAKYLISNLSWMDLGVCEEIYRAVQPHTKGMETLIRVWTTMDKSKLSPRVYTFFRVRLECIPLWQRTVKWMIKVRPYAWHWFEHHNIISCAPGGKNRKRDYDAFVRDCQDHGSDASP
jgi:hypothetical protein